MDDILLGGTSPEKVEEEGPAVWQALYRAEVEVPLEKYRRPINKIKFLVIW